MTKSRLVAGVLLLGCLGNGSIATRARAAVPDTLYCDYYGSMGGGCLFPFEVKVQSDWGPIAGAIAEAQSLFSTLSGAYASLGTAINVATTVLQYLGLYHPGPTLDQKVDRLLSEVGHIERNTEEIIHTLQYTNALLTWGELNDIRNFVVPQESTAAGQLLGLHQWYLLGSPTDADLSFRMVSETFSAVRNLEGGAIWQAPPRPDGSPGPFEWRYAMTAYLYVVSAWINSITAFNPPHTIAPGFGSYIRDRAAFILGVVAETRQWTTNRCQQNATNGRLGTSITINSQSCAVDQWICLNYDYFGSCTEWLWDTYCPQFQGVSTAIKTCDYYNATATYEWGPEYSTFPFHSGDEVETNSLHALGLDNWMHSAAALHGLAVGAAYVGCHTDAPNRALPTLLIGSHATIASCVQAAKNAGLNYAGLQNGGQCWGGNSIGFQQMPDMTCATPCSADGGAMCGGTWANSVYRVFSSVDENPAMSAGAFYAGCHATPALGTQLLPTGATVASCAEIGKAMGYLYVGLSAGGACDGGWSPSAARVSELACTQPCVADATQVCGGAMASNVFFLGPERCPNGGSDGICY